MVSEYEKFSVVERAIAKEGIFFVALVRLAPYPYPLFNALFAASSVPFSTFLFGTMIAQVKVYIMHVSV